MSVPETTDAAFASDVLAATQPVLVDFTAAWCGPCRMIAPVLAQIADDERDRLKVVSLDVDSNSETTRRYGVMSMPTLALFVDGQIVKQIVGARPRAAILRELEPYLPVRA
jgi:thioredoxin 1